MALTFTLTVRLTHLYWSVGLVRDMVRVGVRVRVMFMVRIRVSVKG